MCNPLKVGFDNDPLGSRHGTKTALPGIRLTAAGLELEANLHQINNFVPRRHFLLNSCPFVT